MIGYNRIYVRINVSERNIADINKLKNMFSNE